MLSSSGEMQMCLCSLSQKQSMSVLCEHTFQIVFGTPQTFCVSRHAPHPETEFSMELAQNTSLPKSTEYDGRSSSLLPPGKSRLLQNK